MRTVGTRGLVGQVYTVENGVLDRDDSGALIPLSGGTSGFYFCNVFVNYTKESASIDLYVYKSKAKFKNKPDRPYQIITFRVKNISITNRIVTPTTIDTPDGPQTVDVITEETTNYTDFDTWFLDSVTKVNNSNENRSAIEMIKTFTGSSDLEIRNGIQNTANYTTFTNATIQSGD